MKHMPQFELLIIADWRLLCPKCTREPLLSRRQYSAKIQGPAQHFTLAPHSQICVPHHMYMTPSELGHGMDYNFTLEGKP